MPIQIKTYAGSNVQIADQFQTDADAMSADGFRIVSQSWARNQWGVLYIFCVAFVAIITCGIASPWAVQVFVDPPGGTLTVAYQKD